MLKSYEIYSARRKALRITRQQVATEVGCTVEDVVNFERGNRISHDAYEGIKAYLKERFCDMSSADHYKARALELAIEINDDPDPQSILNYIGHMIVELGKLQMELTNR